MMARALKHNWGLDKSLRQIRLKRFSWREPAQTNQDEFSTIRQSVIIKKFIHLWTIYDTTPIELLSILEPGQFQSTKVIFDEYLAWETNTYKCKMQKFTSHLISKHLQHEKSAPDVLQRVTGKIKFRLNVSKCAVCKHLHIFWNFHEIDIFDASNSFGKKTSQNLRLLSRSLSDRPVTNPLCHA